MTHETAAPQRLSESSAPASSGADIARHLKQVVRGMLNGTVVPLLGAGVNMSGRPPDTTYDRPHPDYLPSGAELARFLAHEFEYPELVEVDDLLRVSQYVEVMEGS